MRYDSTRRRYSLISFDDLFNSVQDPIIINKIDFNHTDYAEEIRKMLYGKSADLTFIAECACGYLHGNAYEGMTCPKCHTVANIESSTSTGILSNSVWISFPNSIPGVLHTRIYDMLSRWLRIGSQNKSYLDVILDPYEQEPQDIAGVFQGRGYQYFYDNFDGIINYFMYTHKKTSAKSVVPYIRHILEKYRYLLFCRNLPILPDKLHTAVSMKPGGRLNADQSSQYVLSAAGKLSFIEFSPNKIRNEKLFNNMIHAAYKTYMSYVVEGIISTRLGKKNSLPRQHIFASRFHWSFRSVITPLPGPHRYDEMHIPWSIGINLLKHHIISRLIHAYDYDPATAFDKQMYAIVKYDPLIDEIMQRLIQEAYDPRGLPVLWSRTPSLAKGSIQKLFVTKVKTSMDDDTISFSILMVKDPNADFDGDEMTGILITEAEAAEKMEVLHPARRYLDTNSPHVGTSIALPPASILLWNTFLDRV